MRKPDLDNGEVLVGFFVRFDRPRLRVVYQGKSDGVAWRCSVSVPGPPACFWSPQVAVG